MATIETTEDGPQVCCVCGGSIAPKETCWLGPGAGGSVVYWHRDCVRNPDAVSQPNPTPCPHCGKPWLGWITDRCAHCGEYRVAGVVHILVRESDELPVYCL